jgi:hypothetical protein
VGFGLSRASQSVATSERRAANANNESVEISFHGKPAFVDLASRRLASSLTILGTYICSGTPVFACVGA